METQTQTSIPTYKCENAHEFLALIAPSNVFWKHQATDWIFRGHANSNWPLLPSALRPGRLRNPTSHEAIIDEAIPSGIMEYELAQRIVRNELEQVNRFFEYCDNHGLQVPGDTHQHRTIEGMNELSKMVTGALDTISFWPPGHWLQVYALAQHYGIATRLLDWTRNPRVAAYFATRSVAEEVANKQHAVSTLGEKTICIWALNKKLLETHHMLLETHHTGNPYLRTVTAPRFSNPNLHAQAGLFTVDGNPLRRVPLDRIISEQIINDKHFGPIIAHFIAKIELPYTHARLLLRLLADEAVSAASVYPGYQGVAMAIAERDFWA